MEIFIIFLIQITSSVIQYSTIYNQEYFDVFSPPITSRYGNVFWTVMEPVSLPQNIINRFNGKPMPIVGYEMDQLFLDNTSVPITWAYNHHYAAYLYESEQQFSVLSHNIPEFDLENPGSQNHGFHSFVKINDSYGRYPYSQFFSEGNGGESGSSYHGYPSGYAQIIYSPKIFRIQPMQIDTRNRNPKFINQSKFVPGILPPSAGAPQIHINLIQVY